MAAKATEMSWTAVTITTGMSGCANFIWDSSVKPSTPSIIKSERTIEIFSLERRTASASRAEATGRHSKPAWLKMEHITSRTVVSSSTTNMRWSFIAGEQQPQKSTALFRLDCIQLWSESGKSIFRPANSLPKDVYQHPVADQAGKSYIGQTGRMWYWD